MLSKPQVTETVEHSTMKSSILFECGPTPISMSCPPYVIHMLRVPRLSPIFAALPLPFIIVNTDHRVKDGGGLRMKLTIEYILITIFWRYFHISRWELNT